MLTSDLGVSDPFGTVHGYLAGVPLDPAGPVATYWTTNREVLVTLTDAVVRCDVRALECERALDRTAVLPLR